MRFDLPVVSLTDVQHLNQLDRQPAFQMNTPEHAMLSGFALIADSTVVASDANGIEIAAKIKRDAMPNNADVRMSDFLNRYDSEITKELDKPGKQQTLDDTVKRINECPWLDQLKVKFDPHANSTEYSVEHSLITFNPSNSQTIQLQNFVHEGYHATHQALGKLYLRDQPLSKDEYVNVQLGLEAGSMIAEIKLRHEMGIGGYVGFKVEDSNGVRTLNVDDIYKTEGTAGVIKMLRDYKPYKNPNYAEHYASFYGGYANDAKFQQNKKAAEQLRLEWMHKTHKPASQFDF